MKYLLSKVLLLTAFSTLVLVSSPAKAALYPITHSIGASLSWENPGYQSSFNIAALGYNPLLEEVVSAHVQFTIIASVDSVDVSVGGLGTGTPLSGLQDIGLSTTTVPRRVLYEADLTGLALDDLIKDGRVKYFINFDYTAPAAITLSAASLVVETRLIGEGQVPDGGVTVSLLGLAMLTLGWARRKLTS